MNLNFYDKTGEPRSDEELQDAKIALKNDLVLSKLTPIMIHYTTILDAIDELLTFRKETMIYKHILESLLAIIHRDGGHYTAAHGIPKSVEDAITIVANERLDNKNKTTS